MKVLLLIFLSLTTLFANIAQISALSGDVTISRDSKDIPGIIGFTIQEKDTVTTKNNARVQLIFKDKTIISLGKNSTFNIEEYLFDIQKPNQTKASFKVARGIFKSITGQIGKINPNQFKLKTKSASIGIRGTIFFGDVAPGQPDSIACTQGAIIVENSQGIVNVVAGQFTQVEIGKLPTPPITIPPALLQQLNQASGAEANEKESKNNEESDKEDSGNNEENNNQENNNAINDVDDVASSVTDAATNEAVNDKLIKDADKSTKTATYKVFGSTYTRPSYTGAPYLNTQSTYQIFNTSPTFTINIGELNGQSIFTTYDYQGTVTGGTSTYSIPDFSLKKEKDSYTSYSKVYTNNNRTIYADNMQEFFIDTSKYTSTISSQEYENDKTIVFGVQTNYNSLPTNGVSKYKTPEYTDNSTTYVSTNGSFINWANGNLLSYGFREGGVFITTGKISEDSNNKSKIDLSLFETKNDFSDKLTSTSSDAAIFGSEYQGWGANINVTSSPTTGQSIYTHGEYKVSSTSTSLSSGTSTFNGFTNLGTSIEPMDITINRDTKSLTANIVDIDLGGTYPDSDTAYITDDTFATFESSGTYSAYNVDNGWLVAYDDGSLYTNDDDQISWGFWGASTNISGTTTQITPYAGASDVWVAGQNIVSDISSLGNMQATFTGQAMGFYGSTFVDPSKSTISLVFDLGAATVDVDLNINNTTSLTRNFTSLDTSTTDRYIAGANGNEITGSFYDGGNTTAGILQFIEGGIAGSVGYKAKK